MLLTRGCILIHTHACSFLWVEQHCIRRTPFSYFLDAWLQLSIYSSYVISRSRKRRIISKHVTINFSRWNTPVELQLRQSPQVNNVQQQILSVFFGWYMIKKTECHCRLTDTFSLFFSLNKIWWSIRSKAFFRSKKTTPFNFESFMEDSSLSTRQVSADRHECCGRNPDWCVWIKLNLSRYLSRYLCTCFSMV